VKPRNLPRFIDDKYVVREWRHAGAVLQTDFPSEWADICTVLTNFRLKKSHISVGGGGKSLVSQSIDSEFEKRGWKEKKFQTEIKVDEQTYASPTHSIDCYKNQVGLEIEWNNKTEFYDRDLNNYRLLFELRVISVGIIITRHDELQDIFIQLGRGSSYGNSTTILSKLLYKLEGGSGGGCPILVFGITKKLYIEDI
jgi:hypothetical protein